MNLIIMPAVAGIAMTARCLDTLLAQDIEPTVFVIDNGSEHLSPLLQSYGKRITSIAHKRRPLTRVWNESLTMAFDSLKLEYALVVNNDTELRPDTYSLLLVDGGGFVTGVSVGTREEMAVLDDDSRSPHPDFSCFLIRRSVWQRVGKFDERIACYCGDSDYHLRMHRAGVEAYSIPVPFFHMRSSTIKWASNALRDQIQHEADRDRETFRELYGFDAGSPGYYEAFR